jgi:SAM-dependent methyltransferase
VADRDAERDRKPADLPAAGRGAADWEAAGWESADGQTLVSGPLPGVRAAYDASATAWAQGPSPAYEAMADVLVAAAMTDMAGARVLDLGAGTGAASRAARRAGAGWVVGVDVAPEMLRAGSGWSCALVADAADLPFAAGGFDLVVAACCLGHLPDPGAALAQARRLAPAVVASAFLAGWTHPAKAVVDAIAVRHGFVLPSWYARLKADVEPEVDDPDRLRALGVSAGYRRVEVTTRAVDVGVRTPGELTRWRLGMAHLAPFVATLGPGREADLRRTCEQALVGSPPLLVPLVVLAASTAT